MIYTYETYNTSSITELMLYYTYSSHYITINMFNINFNNYNL